MTQFDTIINDKYSHLKEFVTPTPQQGQNRQPVQPQQAAPTGQTAPQQGQVNPTGQATQPQQGQPQQGQTNPTGQTTPAGQVPPVNFKTAMDVVNYFNTIAKTNPSFGQFMHQVRWNSQTGQAEEVK